MATSKLTGNDLAMAIIEIAAKGRSGYDNTAMIREVFDFCWDQLGWRASTDDLMRMLNEMTKELD